MNNNSYLSRQIESRMTAMRNDGQAQHLMRFFKCGEGEYGEGDRFLGLRVPQTRAIVREYRSQATIADAMVLVDSQWHEVRLAGFLLMVNLYARAKSDDDARNIVGCYLASLHRANNWDLVDLSAGLLGRHLVNRPEERNILVRLSEMDGCLWHQRVAIVATLTLIRNGAYDPTFSIAEKYLTHTHDLIHKATGWMLREAGKHGAMNLLYSFLDRYAHLMPRTMLRYAIEKFPEDKRRHYLAIKRQ